jgi:hypothetical protein
MRIPRDEPKSANTDYFVAAEEAGRLRELAGSQLDQAVDVGWYEEPGNAIDQATLTLCRLRRARAGEKGRPEYGDEAVRQVLDTISPPALVWLASRAISYMDETGFPEAVEPWFPAEAPS